MSLEGITKKLVIPSRSDVQMAKLNEYNAYSPPNELQLNRQTAQSATAGSSMNWNFPVTHPGLTARDFYIEADINVTLTRATTLSVDYDPLGIPLATSVATEALGIAAWQNSPALNALVSWPLARQSTSIAVTIGGATINTDTQHLLPVMESCFSEDKYLNSYCSSAPVLRDQYPNFGDLFGFDKSPLNRYKNSSIGTETRAGQAKYTVLAAGRTKDSVTVRCQFTEKLICQPFSSNSLESEMCGFIGISQMQIVWGLSNPLANIWSCDGWTDTAANLQRYGLDNAASIGMAPTGVSWVFNAQPVLCFQTFDIPSYIPVSGRYFYPYANIVQYPSNTTVNFIGAAAQVVSGQSITLTGLPRYAMAYLSRSPADQTFKQPYTDALISDIRITIGNRTGLLSNSSVSSLYQISRDGGSQLSFPEFSQYFGSVVVIDIAKSLPLGDNLVVGERGSYQFKLDCTASRSAFDRADDSNVVPPVVPNATYYLNYVFFFEALLVVDMDNGGAMDTLQSVISELDKIEIMDEKFLHYTNTLVASAGLSGGGFSLSNLASKVKSFLKPYVAKVQEYSDRYGPGVQLGLTAASLANPALAVLPAGVGIARTALSMLNKYLGSGMSESQAKQQFHKQFGQSEGERLWLQAINDMRMGSGLTTGGNIGPSFPIGGGRRSRAQMR